MKNNTETKTTSTENVTISRAQYEELLAKLSEAQANLKEAQSNNDGLKSRVEWLEQVLKISNKNRFGAKSEKLKEQLIEGMANLFDEAEATQAVEEHQQQQEESTVVPEHVRRKRRKAEDIIANLPEDTPTEIIEHYLPADETKCPKCGSQMEIIGKHEYKHIVIM